MDFAQRLNVVRHALSEVLVLVGALAITSAATAQSAPKGANVVYTTSSSQTPSTAFIDASAFCATAGVCNSGDDFCVVVFNALSTLPSGSTLPANGGVVDARGVTSTSSTSCSSTSPFQSTSAAIKVPSTLLLPAGTISLGKVWVLPNGTKVIGQGSGSPFSSGGDAVTILQAASGFSGTMIQLGPNSGDPLFTPCSSASVGHCTEVGVENLELVGNANTSGIVNGQSQEMSYARRISIYGIGAIGLKVWNSAQNSGPYYDIACDNTSGSGSATTECVELDVSTLGVRGLNVQSGSSTTASAAVLVQAPNNTLKDVRIQGDFTDGILLQPSTLPASNEVLFNVTGGSGVSHLIHIKGGSPNPQNISIMGVASGGSTDTVLDSVTSTTLTDTYIAMYVLGVLGVNNSAYSRFTTSPSTSAVTWGAGTSLPSSCSKGSLFSCVSTSTSCTSADLYVCTATSAWSSLP